MTAVDQLDLFTTDDEDEEPEVDLDDPETWPRSQSNWIPFRPVA